MTRLTCETCGQSYPDSISGCPFCRAEKKKAVQLPPKVGGGVYATKAERDAANREGAALVLTPLVVIVLFIAFLVFAAAGWRFQV